LGIIVASLYSRGTPNPKEIVLKIALFPPFLAFFAAMLMNIFSADFTESVQLVFQRLGSTVTPIALVAVGLQIKVQEKKQALEFSGFGIVFQTDDYSGIFLCLI